MCPNYKKKQEVWVLLPVTNMLAFLSAFCKLARCVTLRFWGLIFSFLPISMMAADTLGMPVIRLSKDGKGLGEMSWTFEGKGRNFIDSGFVLGNLRLLYNNGKYKYQWKTDDDKSRVVMNERNDITILYQTSAGLNIKEEFSCAGKRVVWRITVINKSDTPIELTDFSFLLPIGRFNSHLPVQENLNCHTCINGHSSFCYWVPYSGRGNLLSMTMLGNTSLEYTAKEGNEDLTFFLHAATAIDRQNDTWRLPGTTALILPGQSLQNGFVFQMANSIDDVRNVLYANGGLDVRITPSMTVPKDLSVWCLVRCKGGIQGLVAEYPDETKIRKIEEKRHGYSLYKLSFSKLGENLVTVNYGANHKGYLNFFSTEPLETLIKKRAHFIATKQQIKDTSKWYDGLYSIWDMERSKLLSPDEKENLPAFVVGGSDDPSNGKPLYVSEKNVVYPDKDEISSLEYYEKNFVWGGLQRRTDEYPYPFGIYGSDNWHENRNDTTVGYNSGGGGRERMWRTFDYTTHFAIYFNLYKIATNNPTLVKYLDAKGYLERAYRTAMAFFLVPYNIEMGTQWNFRGWTDWAYKQGNFHERYIIDIIDALHVNGETEKADLLRREWEKKVKYFIYDDPWPFGSEMDVDRTAFESSFYIAKYAKDHPLAAQEQLWYDKNKKRWYSHLHITDSATDALMDKQLSANLALRGVIEPQFNLLGTAWASSYGLDYMSQMGGVALLDYATQFSTHPATYINVGYNSLLSSWALMNTGNEQTNYGYWYPGKSNDGAAGWVFTPWQHSTTYFKNIPAKRGVWQYDGEIDHGFVGAIHGSSSIVIDDPWFGLSCYGCEITKETKEGISFIPRDGVRQKIHLIHDQTNVSLTMFSDGMAKDSLVSFANDIQRIYFSIENRQGNVHQSSFLLQNLAVGEYTVYLNGKLLNTLTVTNEQNSNVISITMMDQTESITITRT